MQQVPLSAGCLKCGLDDETTANMCTNTHARRGSAWVEWHSLPSTSQLRLKTATSSTKGHVYRSCRINLHATTRLRERERERERERYYTYPA